MKQSLKKPLVIGSIFLVCCMILSTVLMISGSLAKYRARIEGYTDFEVAEFNGALFYQPIGQPSSETFGTDDDPKLRDCLPGMEPRLYEFTIANGTGSSKYATMNISYTIRLRTMENIPFEYSILLPGTDGGDTREFVCSAEPVRIIEERDAQSLEEDATWYEYTLHELKAPETTSGDTEDPPEPVEGPTPDPETPDDLVPEEDEHVFSLSGKAFTRDDFKLKVTWPLTTLDDGTLSNDIKYMKEVELIELVVTMWSENYVKPEGEDPEINPESAKGLVILDDKHVDGITTGLLVGAEPGKDARAYTVDHLVDMRAFRESGEVYTYDFVVNNGNFLYVDGNPPTKPYQNVYYTIKVKAPMDAATKDIEYMLYDASAGKDLDVIDVEYREYDVMVTSPMYGRYITLTEEEAKAECVKDDPQFEVCKILTFGTLPVEDGDEAVEYVGRLVNSVTSDHAGKYSNFAEHQFVLNASSQIGAAIINHPEERDPLYRLTLLVDAITTDATGITELPKLRD